MRPVLTFSLSAVSNRNATGAGINGECIDPSVGTCNSGLSFNDDADCARFGSQVIFPWILKVNWVFSSFAVPQSSV
jgi:hypothetical protein